MYVVHHVCLLFVVGLIVIKQLLFIYVVLCCLLLYRPNVNIRNWLDLVTGSINQRESTSGKSVTPLLLVMELALKQPLNSLRQDYLYNYLSIYLSFFIPLCSVVCCSKFSFSLSWWKDTPSSAGSEMEEGCWSLLKWTRKRDRETNMGISFQSYHSSRSDQNSGWKVSFLYPCMCSYPFLRIRLGM